ncbi:MAG: RluA family pseudouridine synthase [Defluviitaleaceae bacterium]|nr:RluA family pseudouridine synthase [Defluviitaleaceae bacterium]
MKTIKIEVPPKAANQRADIFLTSLEEIPTRSAAQRLLNDGKIKREDRGGETFVMSHSLMRSERNVNKSFSPTPPLQKTLSFAAVDKKYRVKAGDILVCEIPAPVPLAAAAEDIPLNIVYEDSDLLVIDKPRGLVVHPAAGHSTGTLVNALLHHCELSGIGGVLRPGIVHRLDKDTSGLLVVAKNDAAHLSLSQQLHARTMGRTYNAICLGKIKNDRLKIDLPITRHPHDRKKMTALSPTQTHPRARNAVTNIEILQRYRNHTLIVAHLETGRTHQIRVHLSHIGHPILGDEVYGNAKRQSHFNGQILHATNIRFTHPSTREEMDFASPLPEYFTTAILEVTC